MKHLCSALLLLALVQVAQTAPPAKDQSASQAGVRTFMTLRGYPVESLRQQITPELFRSLEVSPVEAYVVARAPIYDGKTLPAKIVRSDANGAYDKMLLTMAQGYRVTGENTIESRLASDSLNLYLLIFGTADGKIAVCISHSDDARYVGYHQYGGAWIMLNKNGMWTSVKRRGAR